MRTVRTPRGPKRAAGGAIVGTDIADTEERVEAAAELTEWVVGVLVATEETRRASPSQRSPRWLIATEPRDAGVVTKRGTPTAFGAVLDARAGARATVFAAAGGARRVSMGLKLRAAI